MKSIYLIILNLLYFITCFSQNPEKRIALVIGNSGYQDVPLIVTVNDARLMSATLKELDFKVIELLNASQAQMSDTIDKFIAELLNYKIVLFYYAGHGIQARGENYLIPVDADLSDPDSAASAGISVNKLILRLQKYSKNTNIIILDACRGVLYRNWRSTINKGFIAMEPGNRTFIAFAANVGETIADGYGPNGLFTSILVNQIKKPISIDNIFKNTISEVQKISSKRQNPKIWNNLMDEFFFIKQ